MGMASLSWTPLDLPPLLIFSTLVLVIFSGVATLFLEFIRRTERSHSPNVSSETFFEDPNSIKQVACPSILDAADKYMTLVIPAFNEEHRLPGALNETMEYLRKRATLDKSFTYEVIIVDDGSSDGTQKVAFDFMRKYTIDVIRVISLRKNSGKGEAIRNGMLHSRGELLLMLDADGATKVSDLEKLEQQIRILAEKDVQVRARAADSSKPNISNAAVAAFGSRAHLEKQALATRKWYRNFLMKGFHFVVLLAAGSGIRDTQCGFKMFTRAAAQKLFSNMRLKRWCFDVELVYLCKKLTIPVAEISVNWSEIPGSKVRLTSILHMLFELALIRLGYGLGIWKIYS